MKRTINLFTFVCFLVVATGLSADPLDEQLNAAYRQALGNKKIDAESLKITELKWIAFRDAEADFQAWLSGKDHPDEAARKASVAQSTQTRSGELLHIAKDGASGDLLKDGDTPLEPSIDQLENNLKSALIAKKNDLVTAAFLIDQRAWTEFSEAQAGDDDNLTNPANEEMMERRTSAIKRLSLQRAALLQADALVLGVDLTKTNPNSDNGPDPEWNEDTVISPDHMLRIEQKDDGSSWIISNKTGQRSLLSQLKDDTINDRGEANIMSSEFYFSPNAEWIFRIHKICSGVSGAYLYQRVSSGDLVYKSATVEPLDILAWKFFLKITKERPFDVTDAGVVDFVSWKPDTLRISLNARRYLNDWVVDFDLKAKAFSVPADFKEHDRGAINPSGQGSE